MDQERWDSRYRDAPIPATVRPPAVLREFADHLPSTGSAIDLAGGMGDAALTYAQAGLDAHLVDVSPIALAAADERARTLGLTLHTHHHDLTAEPIPGDSWAVLSCIHYLNRPLLANVHDVLQPGGVAIVSIATVVNLERHDRPSARFLVDPDELPTLLVGLETVAHHEGWTDQGTHESRVVARRSGE